jgi:hypothetical protein
VADVVMTLTVRKGTAPIGWPVETGWTSWAQAMEEG